MNLLSIQHFIHSQTTKIENNIGINEHELNHVMPDIFEILKNNFSNHACSTEEKAILNEIYRDIQILTKESKDHALFDLKKKIKGIIRTGYFADNFSNVKKGSFENFKHWVSSNLESIKQSLSLSIFNSFYAPYENKKKYLIDQEKINELTQLIDILKLNKKNTLQNAIKKNLKLRINNLETERSYLLRTSSEFEKLAENAIETKRNFVRIGGERLELKTEDKVNLDGMYLSAKEFQKKLIDANIQSFSVNSSFISKDFPIQNGLIFDATNKKAERLLNILERLKLLNVGYVKLEIGDKIAIVPKDQTQDIKNSHFPKLPKEALSIKKFLPSIEDKTGTILIGSGASAIFEMEKRNALSYLMNGLNVMMFNYRGHGLSEGKPTPEGTYKDVEAAYQYLKQFRKIEDKQLIAKGLCLSGGIMAHLASKHPEINLFLDQTYAELQNIALKKADNEIHNFLNSFKSENEKTKLGQNNVFKIIKFFLKPAIKLLSPQYTTLKGIEKIKGKVLILESEGDARTLREELEQMLNHAAKKGTLKQITVGSIPGEHGTMWMDAQETIKRKTYNTGKALVNHFLSSLNFYNPIIPVKKAKEKDIVSPATKEQTKGLKQAFKKESIEKVTQGWEDIEL